MMEILTQLDGWRKGIGIVAFFAMTFYGLRQIKRSEGQRKTEWQKVTAIVPSTIILVTMVTTIGS